MFEGSIVDLFLELPQTSLVLATDPQHRVNATLFQANVAKYRSRCDSNESTAPSVVGDASTTSRALPPCSLHLSPGMRMLPGGVRRAAGTSASAPGTAGNIPSGTAGSLVSAVPDGMSGVAQLFLDSVGWGGRNATMYLTMFHDGGQTQQLAARPRRARPAWPSPTPCWTPRASNSPLCCNKVKVC